MIPCHGRIKESLKSGKRSAAEYYGRIRAELAAQGSPIGPNDLMIAAIALANELTLVTHNVNEFSRISDLIIEDWEAESP